ncbi:hypothetical protein Tco_0038297 [Tanacetum coccineum]
MPPKGRHHLKTPVITLDTIRQLINDGISSALKSQAAAMATSDNSNRNTGTHRNSCSKKKFAEGRQSNILLLASDKQVLSSNEIKKMEDDFYAFIGGLPQSIEGNVTASKPQTLEEAINISQRLMDQIIKHDFVQETNDRKRKLENKRNNVNSTTIKNNRHHKTINNGYHRQQNKKTSKPSRFILSPRIYLEIRPL